MGDICVRHGVIVVSDEIHADFVYPGYRHTVFSTLSWSLRKERHMHGAHENLQSCRLQVSNIFIADEQPGRPSGANWTGWGTTSWASWESSPAGRLTRADDIGWRSFWRISVKTLILSDYF